MSNAINNSNKLAGKVLKVAIGQLPPITTIYKNATGDVTGFGGLFYQELEWLSLKLNFCFTPEVVERSFSSVVNGTLTGMLGKLQREEIDIAVHPFALSSDYKNKHDSMEFAPYVTGDEFRILVDYPSSKTSIFGIFMIFSLKVWIGLLISIIGTIGCIYLVIRFKEKFFGDDNYHSRHFNTTQKSIMYIIGTITGQGKYIYGERCTGFIRSRHRSIGVIAITWCLPAFVFVNIYASCLTSYMSLTFQKPNIGSFQDLATNPHYQVITLKNSLPENVFLNSESETMREIGNKIRHCGDKCRQTDIVKIIDTLLEGNYATLLPTINCEAAIKRTMNKTQCRLTMAPEATSFQHMFMGVPKASPYAKELNQASYLWDSFGLQDYWRKKLAPQVNQCRLKYNSRGGSAQVIKDLAVRFKLQQYYLAFVLLFTGFALAFIQFIRERIAWNSIPIIDDVDD